MQKQTIFALKGLKMKIVAIGAHPDDIEIFFYGFLAAAASRGDQLYLGIATDGAAGGTKPGPQLAKKRAQETKLGLKQLAYPEILGLPDGRLASTPQAQEKILNFVQKFKPDLVVTHAPEDYHPDHRALSKFVSEAVGFTCPVLFCDTLLGVNFTPDFYIDITPYFYEKKIAIMAHKTQGPERFANASAIMNRYRAAQCNAPEGHYAEAFRLDRRFPFSDIRNFCHLPLR